MQKQRAQGAAGRHRAGLVPPGALQLCGTPAWSYPLKACCRLQKSRRKAQRSASSSNAADERRGPEDLPAAAPAAAAAQSGALRATQSDLRAEQSLCGKPASLKHHQTTDRRDSRV